ncbi:unnamed protein product [Phytomonas sp. Hart1]|nr:unnamed protein product [Phytomonas sp. Hart1]|eukprot:CCW69399.1 unnamed protein product [Phytomonas sp. isolate Hart1]
MLDPVATILANDLSRLCVHRQEDYDLLVHIYRRRIAEELLPERSDVYYALLSEELCKRERWHRQCEDAVVDKVTSWNKGVIENQKALEQAYAELGSFQSLWCECIQNTYQLCRSDLESSPFAQLESSRMLYNSSKNSIASIVHEKLFQRDKPDDFPSPSIKERLNALYPTSPKCYPSHSDSSDETSNKTDNSMLEVERRLSEIGTRTRDRLFRRRREFLCFFVIWLHTVRQKCTIEEMPILKHLPAIAVEELLRDERRRLEDMLARVKSFL